MAPWLPCDGSLVLRVRADKAWFPRDYHVVCLSPVLKTQMLHIPATEKGQPLEQAQGGGDKKQAVLPSALQLDNQASTKVP